MALIASNQPVSEEMAAAIEAGAVSTHDMIASLPLWAILILYGIVMPVIEQFIYTGFAYRRARRFMQAPFAYAVIVFLFAFTKNYTIEGVAGFAVYAAILYAFSRYPKIWYAMLLHVVASILVHLQDYCQPVGELFATKTVNAIFAALGALCFFGMTFITTKKSKEENAEKTMTK